MACFSLFTSLEAVPSLHVLIATKGRESLVRMLQSLQPQLETQDHVTVIFDALDEDNVYGTVEEYLKEFSCSCTLVMEPVNLGHWGHGVRDKYRVLAGDFVLHADDDDAYTENAMNILRNECVDPDTLYIFKMQYADGNTIWKEPELLYGGIGTPMGVVPSQYNAQVGWGKHFGGDYSFYQALERRVRKVEYVDQVIYLVRPNS